MYTNITKGVIRVGRLCIMPGDKVPAIPLTASEQAAIEHLVSRKVLGKKEVSAPAPVVVEEPKPAPVEEQPAPVVEEEVPAPAVEEAPVQRPRKNRKSAE